MDFYLSLAFVVVTIFYLVYGKYKQNSTQLQQSSRAHTTDFNETRVEENKTLVSSSSPPCRNWEHHVFVSFRGEDVREGFLSHLLKEFKRKGINPFIDNEMERGGSITPALKRAIKGSRIAIVLISKKYASSSWCLNELVKIIKCRRKIGQKVITIFYQVEPTDVKKQTGEFGKVFKKTCKGKTYEVIAKWREALAEVATITGYNSKNWVDEASAIEEVTGDISKMLNHMAPSQYLDRLIGMDAHMEEMQSLLRLDLVNEVRMIGIWGPLGIGKSTICRSLFNQFSNNFQLKAIMVSIKQSYPNPCFDEGSAQLQLQNDMLSKMINHKDIVITHLGAAQDRLKDKKVLLVLDDVDQHAQLVALAEDIQWFATNLQELDLSDCSSLVELPSSIGNAINLQYLNLSNCSNLVEIPYFIGNATNLKYLYLRHWSSLVELPCSIWNATNLKTLNLSHWSSLMELPSSIGNATNLQSLDLSHCSSLVEIPSFIGNLHKLEELRLQGCSNLEFLPININMERLETLDFTDCLLLKTFPEISTNIGYLNLTGTAVEEVPSTIKSWSRLQKLGMPYSERLLELPHALNTITELDLTDLEEIQELGTWIKGFTRLRKLVLNGMRKLVSLPQLPNSLKYLEAENCESLERLDCSFCNPHIELNFINCFKLNQEARDLIIQTRGNVILPGVEVPTYFNLKASGNSLMMKLNEKEHLGTSRKYRACVLLINEGVWVDMTLSNSLAPKYMNKCVFLRRYKGYTSSENLFIFNIEKEVTSTGCVLEFGAKKYSYMTSTKQCDLEIKECGVVQI